MKRFILALSVSVMTFSGTAFANSPVNFGFETGDTTGWVETYPEAPGNIDVVTNWTGASTIVGAEGSWTVTYKPVKGKYFAVLETGAPDGVFTMLSQTFSLEAGDKLEGWATFCCGSEVYYPYDANRSSDYNDYALIKVFNSQGNTVAEPWSADSFDLGYQVTDPQGETTGEIADFGPLPWQHWSWTASEQGNYTLEYKTTQDTDSEGISYAFFDGPGSKSTAVPEPSSMILFGLAGAGIFGAHRYSRLNTENRLT